MCFRSCAACWGRREARVSHVARNVLSLDLAGVAVAVWIVVGLPDLVAMVYSRVERSIHSTPI